MGQLQNIRGCVTIHYENITIPYDVEKDSLVLEATSLSDVYGYYQSREKTDEYGLTKAGGGGVYSSKKNLYRVFLTLRMIFGILFTLSGLAIHASARYGTNSFTAPGYTFIFDAAIYALFAYIIVQIPIVYTDPEFRKTHEQVVSSALMKSR